MLNSNLINFDDLIRLMCRLEGTLDFGVLKIKPNLEYSIFKLPCGGHIFQVIHTIDNKLVYYYTNTGGGTKVAVLDIPQEKCFLDSLRITITWSPTKIALYGKIGEDFVSAEGKESEIDFRVDNNGKIVQIGDIGVEVKEVRIVENGKLVLAPRAIETWKNTLETLETIQNNKECHDFNYLAAISNVSFIALVSGFEVYLKNRFIEIANEGFPIAKLEIIKYLPKPKNIESEELVKLPLKDIVERTNPNFQNWDIAKTLFKKAYNINFNELVASAMVEKIKKSLRFRHRLVHTSLSITIVNELSVPPEEPIFTTKYLPIAIKCFDEFIEKLHEKTLLLR